MKLFTKYSISAFGLVALLALVPGTAMARGSLYIDIPGVSIGVHDDHGKRYHRKRKYKRSYNNYYNQDRRYERKRDRRRNYRNNYNESYYYDGGRRNYNDRSQRRVEICPQVGYSPYYLRDSGCNSHKDHFHCSDY